MRNHFDKYLNVRDLILTYRPCTILEVGAALGENTMKLLKLRQEVPFRMVTISDNPVTDAYYEVREAQTHGDYIWNQGISYELIPKLPDKSVGMAIIDSDHNYWTLNQELLALEPKLAPECLVVFHDTETMGAVDAMPPDDSADPFLRHTTYGYNPYPLKEIVSAPYHGLLPAIFQFLERNREFGVIRSTSESQGALCIARINATQPRMIAVGNPVDMVQGGNK